MEELETDPPCFAPQDEESRAEKLMDAVCDNDLSLVQSYISEGYHVNFIDDENISPLGCAAFYGNVAMVKTLLEACPQDQKTMIVNQHSSCEQTHTIIYKHHGEPSQWIQLLHTDFGYSPLHWACANPDLKYRKYDVSKIVRLLLEHGANPLYSATDLTGTLQNVPIEPIRAVHLAYIQGFLKAAAILKKAEKEQLKKIEHFTIPDEVLNKSLGKQPPTEAHLSKELFEAAKIGNHRQVKKILTSLNLVPVHDKSIYYVNEFDGLTELSVAANHGHYKVVKVLLKKNVLLKKDADPNYQYKLTDKIMSGPTALHALCRNNNIESKTRIRIAKLLLDHGARTDLPGFDPRAINRNDRKTNQYKHPADLVENCPELKKLLGKEDFCLIS